MAARYQQKRQDDARFPVRVRVAVPGCGLGPTLDQLHLWLRDNLDPGDYATHGDSQPATGDAMSFYFRDVDTAAGFWGYAKALGVQIAAARR